MAVLNHLYRSIKIFSYEDNYGGNVFDNYYYRYLNVKNNFVYTFYSNPMYSSSKLKPINSFDDSKTIKNIDIILKNATQTKYIKINNGEMTFRLPVQVANEQGEIIEVNRIYTATFEKNGKLLGLNAFDENKPNDLTVVEEYEEIEMFQP